MEQLVNIDIFNNDERIVINSACEGTSVSEFTRERLLMNLTFSRKISTDAEVIALLDGLIAKVQGITDGEWTSLRLRVPFDTVYSAEDEDENRVYEAEGE